MKYSYLKSGCRLLTIPKRDTNSTHIAFFVNVGSCSEKKGEYGMAHFLEHMLFKGNRELQSQLKITRRLDGFGADYNAYTTPDTTCYHISVASKYATKAFTTYSNMLLHSTLKKSDMTREKAVVIEEFNKMIDNVGVYVQQNIQQIAFDGTTLGRPTIGYVSDILNLTHNSLTSFYNRYYCKKNMLIVISGKIPSTLFAKVYGIYGERMRTKINEISDTPEYTPDTYPPMGSGLPRELQLYIHKCVDDKICKTICLDKRKEVKQSNVVIAYRVDGIYNNDYQVLQLIGEHLGGGMSSILFQRIRTELGLAYTIRCEMELFREGGLFVIYAGTDGKNCKSLVQNILKEVDRLKRTLLKPKVIRQRLDTVKGKLLLGLEDGMAVNLAYGSRALFHAQFIL